MHVVYRLADDSKHSEHVQRATLEDGGFGVQPTHGLLGSDEWWQHIRDGSLPTHSLVGIVTDVYMAGHNDYPQFDVRSEDGVVSSWTRLHNRGEQYDLYEAGRRVEIDYVIQRLKNPVEGVGDAVPIVLEIRIDADKENESAITA